MALYFFLKNKHVNKGRIVIGDMDDIDQSQKKSLGHAIVIPLLCPKAGVEDLDSRQMLRPTCCLYPSWIKEMTVIVTSEEQRPRRRPHASESGPSEPPRKDTYHGVSRATPLVEDEDSQAHIGRICNFVLCRICVHTRGHLAST